MNLILASSSPRRRELLHTAGVSCRIVPSNVEEVRSPDESIEDYVKRLASEKATEVSANHPEAWVVGADTVVVLDGKLLEKPADRDDAFEMLQTLSGHVHTVYTAVALLRGKPQHSEVTVTTSRVRMLQLDREDILWYVASGEPMDKAGAYAVQGIGAWFIEAIDGSYTNVVGLPLSTLFNMMRRAGIDPLRPEL